MKTPTLTHVIEFNSIKMMTYPQEIDRGHKHLKNMKNYIFSSHFLINFYNNFHKDILCVPSVGGSWMSSLLYRVI